MKWTIHELLKNKTHNNQFEFTLDFSDKIQGSDIIEITPVEVVGDYEIYDNIEYVFYMDIKCTLTMACAITLEPVEVDLDFSVEEVFTEDKEDDFNTIDGITIDLLPIIWSNIILEKPMRVVKDNADYDFESENVELDDNINEAFSKLKDFKN